MNAQGAVLLSLLQTGDLKYYERLQAKYFNTSFSKIYSAISQFYLKYERLPTQAELSIDNSKNNSLLSSVLALSKLDITNVDPEVAITVLENDYSQQYTLKQLRKLVADLPHLESDELLETVAQLPITLEAEFTKSDKITDGKVYNPFRKQDDINIQVLETMLHKDIDILGGTRVGELVLLGGRRGSGKSLICCNIAASAYHEGSIAPYFSIEMPGMECMDRIMSILARVSSSGIRNQSLEGGEMLKLAATKALMHDGGFSVFEAYASSADTMEDLADVFEELSFRDLIHPIYIIDDRELKLSTVDLTVTTLKTKYGQKLKRVLVDYVNQLTIDGLRDDKLDWKSQIIASTKLKSLARKTETVIYSPYQIDANGEARLAKGLLDAVDSAFTLSKTQNTLSLTTAKVRNLPIEEGTIFTTYMNWNTLRYDNNIPIPKVEEPAEDEDS